MYIQIHFKENSNLTPRARQQHWWQPAQSSDLQRGCGRPPGSFENINVNREEIFMLIAGNIHVNRGDVVRSPTRILSNVNFFSIQRNFHHISSFEFEF